MSLQDILNPEPAPDASDKSLNAAPDTAPPPQAHSAHAVPSTSEYRPVSCPTAQDSLPNLAGLAGSVPSPAPWDFQVNGDMHAPTSSSAGKRRASVYGEGPAPIELPQPAGTGRKMSSPTLDQYHVSSRSPEQQRRQSILPTNDQDLTLAPMKSLDTVNEMPQSIQHIAPEEERASQVALGHDSSQAVPHGMITPQNSHAIPIVQYPADQREGPTTSHIRRPSDASQTVSERRPSLASLTAGASGPAQVPSPIASLKQEYSSAAHSPLRESSVPVPSTEMSTTTSAVSRKRPPPKSAGKKGTASTVKKEPAAKKRKTDSAAATATATATAKRAGTPSSQKLKGSLAANKRITSTSATSANSSPAPRSVRTSSPRSSPSAEADVGAESQDEDEDEEQGTPDPNADLYCLCRRPDTGTFMIGCDGGCDDWFHGKCVGIAERDKGLIDKYICPSCEKPGELFTTWKRMCRRNGCRMPAKGAGDASKKGKTVDRSKYCSDECGVRYFEELVSKTRGASDTSPHKVRSKKHRADGTKDAEDDLGPRGGLLSAGELKALMVSAPGVDEFKRLGDGVLSPPLTPSPKATRGRSDAPQSGVALNEAEQERINYITRMKDVTRTRHGVLRDRQKFVPMVKQAATRLAEEKKMKPKEMCGYDPRIAWTEEQFSTWRASPEGSAALKAGELKEPAVDSDGDTGMTNGSGGADGIHQEVCTKRKCARHHEWAKLALDDLRSEVTENSEAMRVLEREEREIKDRAGLRAREMSSRGAGSSVELHMAPKQIAVPETAVDEKEIVEDDQVMVDAGGEAHGSDTKDSPEATVISTVDL